MSIMLFTLLFCLQFALTVATVVNDKALPAALYGAATMGWLLLLIQLLGD